MAPDVFAWFILGTIGCVLLALTIREDLLRRSGK